MRRLLALLLRGGFRTLAQGTEVKAINWEMVWAILVIILILALLGTPTIGAYVHLLLTIAVVVLLIRVIQGRRLP